MQTVRDESGDRYLLLKESAESSLVRDPESGVSKHLPNEQLEAVEDAPPLETAAKALSAPLRTLLTATHDDQSLGLVVELVDRDAMTVRTLLDETTLCESDLHGLLAELVAAGVLAETTVAGERGYEATDTARSAIEHVRRSDRGAAAGDSPQ